MFLDLYGVFGLVTPGGCTSEEALLTQVVVEALQALVPVNSAQLKIGTQGTGICKQRTVTVRNRHVRHWNLTKVYC